MLPGKILGRRSPSSSFSISDDFLSDVLGPIITLIHIYLSRVKDNDKKLYLTSYVRNKHHKACRALMRQTKNPLTNACLLSFISLALSLKSDRQRRMLPVQLLCLCYDAAGIWTQDLVHPKRCTRCTERCTELSGRLTELSGSWGTEVSLNSFCLFSKMTTKPIDDRTL